MIQIIKLATKTKPEKRYEYTLKEFKEIKIPCHYKIIYKCEECEKEVVNSMANWKKKNNFFCQSCSIKKEWKKPEYKEKHSIAISNVFLDPIKREKRSLISKKRWSDEEYRKKHTEIIRNFCKTKEYKEKISTIQKERWKNLEYREKVLKLFNSEEYKIKQKESCKKKWNDPEFIKKQQNRQWGYIIGLKHKDVYCRSLAEFAFLKYIDNKVKSFEICDFSISYVSKNNEIKKYIPDFKLTNYDNSITIVEVKGSFKKDFKNLDVNKQGNRFYSLDKETNKLKENALILYCKKKEWKTELITFDNKEFYDLYKKERKKYHENKKNNTSK